MPGAARSDCRWGVASESESTGVAEIAGLEATAGGSLIELSAQKPGCEVSFASHPHTGKYVVEPGVLTVAGAFVPPISPPE